MDRPEHIHGYVTEQSDQKYPFAERHRMHHVGEIRKIKQCFLQHMERFLQNVPAIPAHKSPQIDPKAAQQQNDHSKCPASDFTQGLSDKSVY
ncbi:hypothetical protein D1872_245530 [compost metagenome]